MPRKEKKSMKPKIEVRRIKITKYANEADYLAKKPYDIVERHLTKGEK